MLIELEGLGWAKSNYSKGGGAIQSEETTTFSGCFYTVEDHHFSMTAMRGIRSVLPSWQVLAAQTW
jgi:predicted outer membrane repeat protein